jgi:deoxyribodipyrimidine photolyase
MEKQIMKKTLDKWKKGNTGIRIVDAAMNELYETGLDA